MSISDIFAQLESGRGQYNYLQPASMVNPTYGQYSGFVRQYGSGATGIENYAYQTYLANPNATIGDVYAGYVLGTGTPGAYTFSDLQAQNPAAAQNFINNAGVAPTEPVSGYLGYVATDGSYVSPDASTMLTNPELGGVTTGVDPTQFYVPGTDTPLANQSGVSQFQFDPSGLYTNTPEAGAVQQGLGGSGSTSSGTDWWATFWNVIGNLLQRAGLGLLGIILIAAAAWAASRGDFGKGAQHAIRSV